jgi:protein-S-isoprenylcysteine O-methyltransferase Ste14
MSGRTPSHHAFARTIGLAYATVGFVATHVIFCVLILFLLNWIAYPSIDGERAAGTGAAVAIDLVLIVLFGLQHSGMARSAVKQVSHGLLPEALERATYVHFSNLVLALLVFAWQPIPVTLWAVEDTAFRAAILSVFFLGWALTVIGSMLIDYLQLFGLRQAWSWFNGETYEIKPLQRQWLYDRIRHPIQFGLILAFWATPDMTVGHLLFAGGLTLYIIAGTHFEETDLIATFGDEYADYRLTVPGLIPRLRRTAKKKPDSGGA